MDTLIRPPAPPTASAPPGGGRFGYVAAFLIGATLSGAITWGVVHAHPGAAQVQVIEGTTYAVNSGGNSMVILTTEPVPGTFSPLNGQYEAGYGFADATEIGDTVAHDHCLPPSSSGQRVRLGIVNAAPVPGGTGGVVVVWYECLTEPTGTI